MVTINCEIMERERERELAEMMERRTGGWMGVIKALCVFSSSGLMARFVSFLRDAWHLASQPW